MRKPILAILALILASLACTQAVVTVTPTVSTPAPSETHAPAATPTVSPAPGVTAEVVKTTVNVRLQPGGVVVGALRDGDTVQILSCSGDWCEVKLYVFRGCLSGNADKGCASK